MANMFGTNNNNTSPEPPIPMVFLDVAATINCLGLAGMIASTVAWAMTC